MGTLRTPLYEIHKSLGARFTEFHGYELPLEYTTIVEEHLAARKQASLFDLSHMGEIEIRGGNAIKLLQRLITNDVESLTDGKVLYTPICNPQGGIIDDIIVYRFNKERFLLVVNASNIQKVYKWMESNPQGGADVLNRSEEIGMVAIQGPISERIMETFDRAAAKLPHHSLIEKGTTIISRTGYTGEDGFEVYTPNNKCQELWERLMDAGKALGLKPAGLGARDTLRLEAGLLLYGNDINETTTPLEAGIGWTVKFYKEDFIGKESLLNQKVTGIKRKLVGLELIERGIPRAGYPILFDSKKVGQVTSGTFSPYFQKPLAMGYVQTDCLPENWPVTEAGAGFSIEIRGTQLKAKIVKLPFYKKGG